MAIIKNWKDYEDDIKQCRPLHDDIGCIVQGELEAVDFPVITHLFGLPIEEGDDPARASRLVQRTKKEQTRKGYDTTGYGYQFLLNRLNAVLGVGRYSLNVDVKQVDKISVGDRIWFDAIVAVSIVIGASDVPTIYSALGGHRAPIGGDAVAGAVTRAIKKVLGYIGIGREAYEGSIDDDNIPVREKTSEINKEGALQAPLSKTCPLESGPSVQSQPDVDLDEDGVELAGVVPPSSESVFYALLRDTITWYIIWSRTVKKRFRLKFAQHLDNLIKISTQRLAEEGLSPRDATNVFMPSESSGSAQHRQLENKSLSTFLMMVRDKCKEEAQPALGVDAPAEINKTRKWASTWLHEHGYDVVKWEGIDTDEGGDDA